MGGWGSGGFQGHKGFGSGGFDSPGFKGSPIAPITPPALLQKAVGTQNFSGITTIQLPLTNALTSLSSVLIAVIYNQFVDVAQPPAFNGYGATWDNHSIGAGSPSFLGLAIGIGYNPSSLTGHVAYTTLNFSGTSIWVVYEISGVKAAAAKSFAATGPNSSPAGNPSTTGVIPALDDLLVAAISTNASADPAPPTGTPPGQVLSLDHHVGASGTDGLEVGLLLGDGVSTEFITAGSGGAGHKYCEAELIAGHA